jgi:molybdate transport system ATP-binding protein
VVAGGGGVVTAAVRFDGQVRAGSFVLDAALAVEAGEIVAVLGPNGAGKTTLLRALAGLAGVQRGTITVGEIVWAYAARDVFVPPERRPIGYVFQNYRLFPHLTVRDNVAFAARSHGESKRAARMHAQVWLERLGLGELAGRSPRELSGGQAQRVALARALAARPSLLLLDEPLAALDAQTRLDVRTELRRHLRDFDGPTVLVTHDPLEAMVLADRLVVLEGGRVVQQGSPAEVARRPATEYTAKLVGLNLYRGTVASDGVHLDTGGVLVSAAHGEVGADVLVAVRPSAITIFTERPEHASPRNLWQASIESLELLTDRVRVQVRGAPDALVDVTPDAVAALGLAENGRVWLSAKATEVDVYTG